MKKIIAYILWFFYLLFSNNFWVFFLISSPQLNAAIVEPNAIANLVFHFDAQDVNGDGNSATGEPSNNDRVATWVDAENSYNAIQTTNNKRPRYRASQINGLPAIDFDWNNDIFNIANQNDINTASNYTEKSFATVIQTSNDINTFQTIYEQGGTIRWYNFMIENWHIYAGVWNNNEWDTGHQYKSVDMWVIEANTTYFPIIVQESLTGDDNQNKLSIYLNWNLAEFQVHVDSQRAHGGAIWLAWVSNDTVKASDNSPVSIGEWHYFDWYIGEMISWNHALDAYEREWLLNYFSDRWWVSILTEITPVPGVTESVNPSYTFSTNNAWTLSYAWSCNSTTTSAIFWDNTIVFDSDGLGGALTQWNYNDCIITLTDWFWNNTSLNVSPFEVVINTTWTGSILPWNIPNIVFHYDLQDSDWDWNPANEPANGTLLPTIVDKENSYNATQWNTANQWTYITDGINNLPAVNFAGTNDFYDIANQSPINTAANYDEKSFAAVFKTWNDVSTFQNIYEQWGTSRWYSFIVHNGYIYAWVWNNVEWDTGHQYKSVNLWIAQTNTVYYAVIVQNSTSAVDSDNKLYIYLNGVLSSYQDHVDAQGSHGGTIALWKVSGNSVRASDNAWVWDGNYFNGHIWEMISWNQALSYSEVVWINNYFSDKWQIAIFNETQSVTSPTTSRNPLYKFETNRVGTLSYGGSCNSSTTNAVIWENTIVFDSNGTGWQLADGTYADCTITLTEPNTTTHILSVTPFTIEWSPVELTEVTPIPTPTSDSTPNYTFNSPISGTIFYSGDCSSGTTSAIIWNNTITLNSLSDWIYINCYIKVKNVIEETPLLHISNFEITTSETTPPTISSINFASGSLLPGWNHNIIINFNDAESGIDTSSDSIALYKWNGSVWGPDISASGLDLGSKVVNTTSATYPMNNLNFWKYRYDFSISDNDSNSSSTWAIFYIDIPELTVSSWSIDIWNVNHLTETYSETVTITVKTVGAGFNVILNRSSDLEHIPEIIPSWDGSEWYGYDLFPFGPAISTISTDEIISSQAASINADGNKNTYTYDIKNWSINWWIPSSMRLYLKFRFLNKFDLLSIYFHKY